MDTHRQSVCRLYRRALRWAFDWKTSPDDHRARCIAIREEFDRHRTEKDPARIAALVAAGEHALWLRTHPEPYVHPSAPGGVAFERHARFSREFALHGYNPKLDAN